jgi:hypothetical protein
MLQLPRRCLWMLMKSFMMCLHFTKIAHIKILNPSSSQLKPSPLCGWIYETIEHHKINLIPMNMNFLWMLELLLVGMKNKGSASLHIAVCQADYLQFSQSASSIIYPLGRIKAELCSSGFKTDSCVYVCLGYIHISFYKLTTQWEGRLL